MADNWFNSLFKTKTSLQDEIKSLREKLDDIDPKSEYAEKFFDIEPGTASHINHFEFGGIDQMINDAVLTALYATETWVYTAITAIAKTVAGLPLRLEKRTKIKETVISDITGLEEQVDSEKWTDASGEKLFERFQYPNKYMTKSEFLMLITIDFLSTGQYFIYLDSDEDLTVISNSEFDNDPESQWGRMRDILSSNTKIKGMYRLPPTITKPIPREDGYGIEGYVMQSEAGQFVFDCAEVIHVKFPNPLNMYVGLSPLVAAFKPVLLDRFSTEHMVRFYKTGARLGGLIETEQKMNKEQLSRFQRSFENNFTGRHNFHRTLILPPGMTYKQIEQNPAETALLEFAKYNREAILSVYNVPPIKVGILDGATYANALAQLKIFFSDTVKPILTFIEDGFNLKNSLFPDTRTFRLKFDLSEVEALKESNQELATTATQMLNGGLSVNEVRKRVWKASPVKDGDKIKVIEDMSKDDSAGSQYTQQLLSSETRNEDELAKNQITDPTLSLSGAQASAMMSVVQQVAQGFLPRESGVEMIIASFSVPREVAERIMGEVGRSFNVDPNKPLERPQGVENPVAGDVDNIADGKIADAEQKDVVSNNQQLDIPAIASDIKPTDLTYSQRVVQLTELYMQRDKLPLSEAIRRAVEQAKAEGLDPEDPQPNGPSGDAPAQNSEEKAEDKSTAEQILDQPKLYAFGMTKDQVVENWKSFIDKTDPLIEKRLGEVQKFFKDFKSAIMNEVGANIKSYGFYKARNSDDADEILDEEHYEKLLKQYVEEIDKALLEAYKTGFLDTLTTFKFDVRNEVALDTLRKYAADKIKGISDTTRDQIKQVLVQAFDEGVAVNEIAARINEKFAEINAGRAMTIARTETLTAVSMGQEAKREEFKEQFPGTPLKKMWVSAQDDKVRDSHVELDGQSVGVDEEFKEGLRFPRDPMSNDPAEVINCRCTILTFAEEDQAQVESSLGSEEEKSVSSDKQKVTRLENETLDECVKRAIPKLIEEGMSQEQAVAAAYSMCELPKRGG